LDGTKVSVAGTTGTSEELAASPPVGPASAVSFASSREQDARVTPDTRPTTTTIPARKPVSERFISIHLDLGFGPAAVA
jgi:hypothetical protein